MELLMPQLLLAICVQGHVFPLLRHLSVTAGTAYPLLFQPNLFTAVRPVLHRQNCPPLNVNAPMSFSIRSWMQKNRLHHPYTRPI